MISKTGMQNVSAPNTYYGVDGPGELVGEDAERLALAVPVFEASDQCLTSGIALQEQDGRFGKGPLQIGLPILAPPEPETLPADSFFGLTSRA